MQTITTNALYNSANYRNNEAFIINQGAKFTIDQSTIYLQNMRCKTSGECLVKNENTTTPMIVSLGSIMYKDYPNNAKRALISMGTIKRMSQFNMYRPNKDVPYYEGYDRIMWNCCVGDADINGSISIVEKGRLK